MANKGPNFRTNRQRGGAGGHTVRTPAPSRGQNGTSQYTSSVAGAGKPGTSFGGSSGTVRQVSAGSGRNPSPSPASMVRPKPV